MFFLLLSFVLAVAMLALRENIPAAGRHGLINYSDFQKHIFIVYGLISVNLVLFGLNSPFRFKKFLIVSFLLYLSTEFVLAAASAGTSQLFPLYYAAGWIIFFVHLLFKKNLFTTEPLMKHIFLFLSSGILLVFIIFSGASRRFFPEPYKHFFLSVLGLQIVFAVTHLAIILLFFNLKRIKFAMVES